MKLSRPSNLSIAIGLIIVLAIGAMCVFFYLRHTHTNKKAASTTLPSTSLSLARPALAISQVVNNEFGYLDTEGHFHRYNLATSTDTALAGQLSEPFPHALQWSPDLRYILARNDEENGPHLFAFDTEKNSQILLTYDTAAWVDNTTLLGGTYQEGTTQISRLTIGGDSENITTLTGQVSNLLVNSAATSAALLVTEAKSETDIPTVQVLDLSQKKITSLNRQALRLIGWSQQDTLAFLQPNDNGKNTLVFYQNGNYMESPAEFNGPAMWKETTLITLQSNEENTASTNLLLYPENNPKKPRTIPFTQATSILIPGQDKTILLLNNHTVFSAVVEL